jgi:hypothetical protein
MTRRVTIVVVALRRNPFRGMTALMGGSSPITASTEEKPMSDPLIPKDALVSLLYEHQEDALTNYDNDGREECRCGHQGDQGWRQHFADVLLAVLPCGVTQ